MVEHDPVEHLALYLDWLRRRFPGWRAYAESNEGQMGWIAVYPDDPTLPRGMFHFPPNQEEQGLIAVHSWLMDLHRAGKLPRSPWGPAVVGRPPTPPAREETLPW